MSSLRGSQLSHRWVQYIHIIECYIVSWSCLLRHWKDWKETLSCEQAMDNLLDRYITQSCVNSSVLWPLGELPSGSHLASILLKYPLSVSWSWLHSRNLCLALTGINLLQQQDSARGQVFVSFGTLSWVVIFCVTWFFLYLFKPALSVFYISRESISCVIWKGHSLADIIENYNPIF